MTFLSLDGVSRSFGGLRAVNAVSFGIEKGEILGLLGPNGSGKTTLLNLISGALAPDEGRIVLAGTDLAGRRADIIARAGIARTFQLVRILPTLSLEENVMVPAMFGAKPHKGDAAREVALRALRAVGLERPAETVAADLTYIDQKRLELARALAAGPQVLLLDEWLAGLNPSELGDGIALIRSLAGSGLTILMVEHIMKAVRMLCPRSLVMNSGTLIADGPTETVLSDPHVIAAYLGEVDHA